MTVKETISVQSFTQHPEVLKCIEQLESKFGKNGQQLIVSDVVDSDGHQYVNLVQKGGGVLGIALVGYTYMLEQMGIRFIRLAGTSAGAINTALMTVIGATKATSTEAEGEVKAVKGNKQMAKSEEVLREICELNFFDLVDGHPVARWIIRKFITNKDFSKTLHSWIKQMLAAMIILLGMNFICLGLQHQFP